MKNKKDNVLTREQLWKIWDFLGTDEWKSLLDEHKRSNHFINAGQDTLKGLCIHPDHQDTSPSFFIHVSKGYAKCYGGSCNYYESNPLQVLAHVLGVSYPEALQFVQDNYKPPFIKKNALKELEAQRLNQELKQEIFAAAHQLMCEAVNDPTNPKYAYAKKGLDWLIHTRNIPKDTLHALPVAIMPELARLTEKLLDRHKIKYYAWEKATGPATPEPYSFAPDANNYFADYIRDPVFSGGILLPLHVTPKEIGNFKLRSPDSSKKFVIVKDPHEPGLGMFGLGWDPYTSFWGQGNQAGYAHIFEGEFDALAVMSRFVQKSKVKFPVLSAGGAGGAQHIETCMKSSGITKLYLAGDAPEAKGDEIVQKWMEYIVDLELFIFSGWDRFPGMKDFDEVINKVGLKPLTKALWDDQARTFSTPWMWAVERATVELDAIPEQEFSKRIETAANHGKYLNNRLEREKFTSVIGDDYNLNPSLLKREITSRESTESGFILRCVDALEEDMFVVGTRESGNSNNLVLYDMKSKRFCPIQLDSEQSMVQRLGPIYGTAVDFVINKVGAPAFLEFPDANSEGLVLNKLEGQLRKYITLAVVNMSKGSPDFTTALRYGQGYHHIKDQQQEYVICGSDVFHLLRDGKDHKYVQLEGPADHERGIIFDIGLTDTSKKASRHSWYPGGLTIEKLNKGKGVDLPKLFDELVHVFDTGYKFKNHEVTTQLLAALTMCYPIMDAFKRPILVFVSGDTNSGKSSLLSTLADVGYPGIRLLYSSQGHENYTHAGIAGATDGDSRLLILDEFESGDTERGTHVNRILEMYRGLISGEATRVRGKQDGSSFEQSFRLPVIFSAIKGAERAQDLNRMLAIEMQKIPGKMNSVTAIHNEIGKTRVTEMAEELAVGLYPHALELEQIEKEVEVEYTKMQKDMPIKIEWRLASSLFSVFAMMKFVGKDWKTFMTQYVEDHQYAIGRTATVSETTSTLKSIMRNDSIKQADGPNMTPAQMLASAELRSDLNMANKGFYYDEKTKTFLILVDQGPQLIPYHLRGKTTGSSLKNILERHNSALSPEEILESGVLSRVSDLQGAGIDLEDVVVFNAAEWLRASPETGDATPLKPEEKTHAEEDTSVKDKADYGDDWEQ